MTTASEHAEELLRRPGLREAVAEWEKRRRPGQLLHHAAQHGVTITRSEAEALEFQSVLRQSSSYSAQAVMRRR
jgi:hypothetical protein